MSRKNEYRQLRITVGTQEVVATMLGISVNTLSRRESGTNGDNEPTQEQFLALRFLSHAVARESPDREDDAPLRFL